MKQREVIDWAMIGLAHEMRRRGLSEEQRQELERKHKELAAMYLMAIIKDK